MNFKYIKMYWATLKGTAMWNQKVTIVTYNDSRELWHGTVGQFVEETLPNSVVNNYRWMVVFFGYPAITEADEAIPVYNRAIEIQVI